MVQAKMWQGIVVLTGIVEKEGDQFVSVCRELGTASCGTTVEEAFRNLDEAIEVHLNALEETGELLRVFREKHIRIDMAPVEEVSLPMIPLGKIFTTFKREVPVPAM